MFCNYEKRAVGIKFEDQIWERRASVPIKVEDEGVVGGRRKLRLHSSRLGLYFRATPSFDHPFQKSSEIADFLGKIR